MHPHFAYSKNKIHIFNAPKINPARLLDTQIPFLLNSNFATGHRKDRDRNLP